MSPFFRIAPLLCLAVLSCEERAGPSEQAENSQPASSSSLSPADREPIRNTDVEGAKMDTRSNAYIVFDGSGSMSGEPIEQAKRAVAAFVAKAPPELNIGLAVFDERRIQGQEVVPLGHGPKQREQLMAELAAIRAGGGTPLGSTMQIGTDALVAQFQKQLRYGDIRLIVVTDGAANDGRAFGKSIEFAQRYHVPIYTIGFRIRDDHPLRQYSEAYFSASDEAELLEAMEETLAELDDSVTLDF